MQIHEITKLQRTDEGLLSGVKDAITTAKNTAVNAVKNPVSGGKFQQAQNVSALDQANAIRQKLNAKYNLGDKAVQAPVRGANQRGELSLSQKLELAKRDPKSKQKVAQLVKAFDQDFDTGPDVQYQVNPDAAKKYAQQQKATPAQPAAPQSKLQQTINAQNKQMSPQSGIAEGSLAQRSQARNAPVAQAQPTPVSNKKDIRKDFTAWIGQHIPGIEDVAPEVQQQLDQSYKKMLQAKGNTQAVDAAFEEYVTIALAAVNSGQRSFNQPSSSNASYTQQQAANQLGISPDAISKLQQRMAQNQETVKSKTGSNTLDTLITAVTGK